ncbi:hypothetical protein ABID82_002252 [Methylobacterium sp. PvP062]|uniref:Uncharacterized protein n=1 Tax=Methylobacterium radiotolerans TaxID=31998 RepID=A0ABV2NMW1_9HYPH|nr:MULTISPECIES: hypothetical protein [unclassified Methylobacterium]MBP2495416.1 hypothetical protein [Methylobacterium sp. PvP105]MBP2504713.1 hypothetical protein [Methylobacterium sp. PvP109]MCX7335726.1 hypothetical protein [Hyphomicrobiales bacterium]
MSALTDAQARRDAGMEAAAEAERRDQPEYAPALYAAILAVARRQSTVHVDDVLPILTVRAQHFNAAGSVWARAIRDGVIVRTGRVRACRTDRTKHAHQSPVYRSMLFADAPAAAAPARRSPTRPAALPGQIDLFSNAGGAL